ncbi:MAG: GtrA family protein [Thermoplasmatales archaeon]|nr:GtrA family protein [Thermoplasmatales archaeon]MCW6171073.1 GtrA family protein [Thermoplasmatales archaeon]
MAKLRENIILFIEKNLVRMLKYSLSGFVGFASLEFLTFLGISLLGYAHIILIDIIAFTLAVAIEFIFQEYWTTHKMGEHHGRIYGLIIRLLKFEILNVIGNAVAIATQFSLFKYFGLYPLIGNFIGSAVAFPFNYYIQMRLIWKIRMLS